MTTKQKAMLTEFLGLLPDEQKSVFGKIARHLYELGYAIQRQKVKDFVISFKHSENGKVIAKMGFRNKKGFFSLRFFACASVPEKYINALCADIISQNEQYSGVKNLNPVNMITNKCGYCEDICSGGGLGYYCKLPDGRTVTRCGAYPVVIPEFGEADISEMMEVIREQHDYFLSIAK